MQAVQHTHRTCKVPTISSTDPADDPLLKELNAAFSSRVSPKEATELALKKLKKKKVVSGVSMSRGLMRM